MQILWNVGIRLESSCLQGNAQISAFAKKLFDILFVMKKIINLLSALNRQPYAVQGRKPGTPLRKGKPAPKGRHKPAVRAGGESRNIFKAFTALCS